MVRPAKLGRSRACEQCRKRRIKCDLTQPKCLRCTESSRECSGPLTGVLILEAQLNDNGKVKNKLVSRSARTSGNPAQHAAVSTHNDVLLPTLDTSSMHEEILLDRFLGFFVLGARKSSWVLKLPDLRNSSSASTLRSGLRAVTLAYAAHQTQDVRVKVAAYKNYATSLSGQRMALSRLQVSNSQAAVYVLLATVILSYFELISCTTSEAWSEHTKAAERLITMLDPGLLKHDLMLGVFHSVRSHAIQRAVCQGHYTIFSEDEWLESVKSHKLPQSLARDSYDRVVELMLRLCRKQHSVRSRRLPAQGKDPTQVSTGTFLNELETLYNTFLQNHGLSRNDAPLFSTRAEASTTPTTPPETTNLSHVHPSLRTAFGTITLAYFHSAMLLLVSFHHTNPCSSKHTACTSCSDIDTNYNAHTIIAAGHFMSAASVFKSNGTAVLRMRLPFSVIWRCCTNVETKRYARKLYEDWCAREGLYGLKAVGFDNPPQEIGDEAELRKSFSINTHHD